MKKMILSTMTLLALSLANANPKAIAAKDSYMKSGKELMAMVNSGKIDQDKATSLTDTMVKEGATIAEIYATLNPQAKKFMDFVVGKIPDMKKSSFDVLQKDYHDGGAYTAKNMKMKDADKDFINVKKEENEKYLDPVHTIVHPIMTAVALKENKIAEAKEELAEGLEQVESTLKQIK
jgi:hypothetical protein